VEQIRNEKSACVHRFRASDAPLGEWAEIGSRGVQSYGTALWQGRVTGLMSAVNGACFLLPGSQLSIVAHGHRAEVEAEEVYPRSRS